MRLNFVSPMSESISQSTASKTANTQTAYSACLSVCLPASLSLVTTDTTAESKEQTAHLATEKQRFYPLIPTCIERRPILPPPPPTHPLTPLSLLPRTPVCLFVSTCCWNSFLVGLLKQTGLALHTRLVVPSNELWKAQKHQPQGGRGSQPTCITAQVWRERGGGWRGFSF